MTPEKKVQLLAILDSIVAELTKLGVWDMSEAELEGTFLGTLRFGMIPGIKARLGGEHPLPPESNLGVFAVREFDGQDAFQDLSSLLSEFDWVYNNG